jgi:hypothetical protein
MSSALIVQRRDGLLAPLARERALQRELGRGEMEPDLT